MADHSGGPGRVAELPSCAELFWLSRMAARVPTQDDIPGAFLLGREPQALKCEKLRFSQFLVVLKLRFSLKFRNDSLRGLKTKTALMKR